MARPDPLAILGALSLLLGAATTASAQVSPGGLGTRVNGTALGRCGAGICTVQGGTVAGRTLFHRFSQFDTRAGIRRVDLDTRGRTNVVVGVSHPSGSFFGAPLRLQEAANLFWLSPGGIWLGRGGQIQGATSLLLSTAPTLRVGGGEFAAVGGLGDGLGNVGDDPKLDLEALAQGRLDGGTLTVGDGPIVLAGGRIQVDRHLLLNSGVGPIRSAPGDRSELRAGGSVQLSGGDLRLRGLGLEAGTAAADNLVRLRSGPLAAGGLGRLELVEANLGGARVLLEGAGGLDLRQVEVRGGGAATAGLVQLIAGAEETAAAARLDGVTLIGSELRLSASGPLTASNLRAEAGADGGVGRLVLEAGAGAAGEPSLRLEGADLAGRTVVIRAQGPIELRQVQARATEGTDTGAQGAGGELSLTTSPGPGGAPSPIQLETVRLSGDSVALQAAGGDLWGRELEATAQSIQLRAGAQLSLAGGSLQARGPQGLIQIDAISGEGSPGQGRLDLRATSLQGQTILGRADQTLNLRDVTAVAGTAGNRGVIRLETAPAADPPQGPGPGTSGAIRLEGGSLAGQWLLVRSGTIELSDTRMEAPKGILHLEARSGDLAVRASHLDVGVRQKEDLRREVVTSISPGRTLLINNQEPTPSVGLFAAGNLLIHEGSRLRASQDLTELSRTWPGLGREDIRLLDTSGVVIADAGQGLTILDSHLEANASLNLAGDIILRAQATHGTGTLSLRNTSIRASGGAGSGDIRLNSANGITIENSSLQARASLRREEANRPGVPSASQGFSGGEITLTNSSLELPIKIQNSQLDAAQTLSEKLLPAKSFLQPLANATFFDRNDDGDNRDVYTGGIINILSAAGIQISGAASVINVGLPNGDRSGGETIGGILRIANLSPSQPIQIEGGAFLGATTNPSANSPTIPAADDAGDPTLPDARGRINLWSHGPILLENAHLDASTWPSPGYQSPDNESSQSISLLSATSIQTTGGSQRFNDPEGRSLLRIDCPTGCNRAAWDSGEHEQFLLSDFWGTPSGRSPSFDLVLEGTGVKDLLVSGDPPFAGKPESVRQQIRDNPDDYLVFNDAPPLRLPANPAAPGLASRDHTPLNPTSQPLPPTNRTLAPAWQTPGLAGTPIASRRIDNLTVSAADPIPDQSFLQASASQALPSNEAQQVFFSEQDNARRDVLRLLGTAGREGRRWDVPSLQQELRRAMREAPAKAGEPVATQPYRPAILQISISSAAGQASAQINQVLISADGQLQGWQSQVSETDLKKAIRRFQNRLIELADLETDPISQQLATVLLGPVIPEIKRQGITALLLSLDRGLQGVAFAALPIDSGSLADLVAVTVTPTLSLTDLAAASAPTQPRILLAGASQFPNGLAPLPMARQELQQLARLLPQAQLLVDREFHSQSLLQASGGQPLNILHIASHADFLKPESGDARIYTSDGEISLKQMAELFSRSSSEMNLFVLNACRTAIGDEQRELGIAGLALQAGARSALGNLWYVDDVATAAFSLQFHRNLQQGFRKDQALRETQLQFRRGSIRVAADRIVNARNETLIAGLSRAEQLQLDAALRHPYYWAGAILSGSPW